MSKIKPFLSDLLLVAVTFLFAALLTGCGNRLDPETEIAACRAALKELQNQKSCYITSHRAYVDDGTYTDFDYWKNGDDWMEFRQPNGLDVLDAVLYIDGQLFNNSANFKGRRKNDIKWAPYDLDAANFPLWLELCRIEDQEIRHLSSASTLGGRIVRTLFLTPYAIGDQSAEGYTVDFYLDRNGHLKKAVMSALFKTDNGGEDHWRDEMTVVTIDPEKVAARIDREYRRALEQNGMTAP